MTTPKQKINLNLTYGTIGRQEKFKTKEEAQERQEQVLSIMAQIKSDIDDAKKHTLDHEDRARDEWLLSAQRALSEYQIQHQELSRIIGEFSKISRDGFNIEEAVDFNVTDYVKIHGSIGVEQDFPTEVVECEALQYQVLKDMASIKDQIKRAASRAKSGRGYSSSHWYISANTALKIKQATHQALLGHTARLRRELTRKDNESFPRNFMVAARELLSKEVYGQLIERAHQLVGDENKSSSI